MSGSDGTGAWLGIDWGGGAPSRSDPAPLATITLAGRKIDAKRTSVREQKLEGQMNGAQAIAVRSAASHREKPSGEPLAPDATGLPLETPRGKPLIKKFQYSYFQ
jgi:hypothetical protein